MPGCRGRPARRRGARGTPAAPGLPTSVRLDAKTEAIVARLGRRKSLSKSDVIREAIVAYGEEQERDSPGALWARVEHVIGSVHSGRGDLSQGTGEKFLELLVEDRRRERRGARPRHPGK